MNEKTALLDALRDGIVRLCAPCRIYVFNQKSSPSGEVTAVKLCVIVPGGDPRETESRLYVQLESDLPFDLLVYTQEEWHRLLQTRLSFARHIRETGRLLYAAD